MNTFDTALTVLSFFIDFNFLTLVFILWFINRGNKRANRILALGLFALVIVNISLVLYTTRFFYHYPHFMRIHGPFMFLIPLVLYFYLKAVLKPAFEFKLRHLWHLLPAVLIIGWNIPFYVLSANEKVYWLTHNLYTKHHFFAALVYAQFLFYFVIIIKKYSDIKRDFPNDAAIKAESLQWIKDFMKIVFLIVFCEFIPLFLVPFKLNPLLYVPIISSVLFYALVYKAIANKGIFLKLEKVDDIIETARKNRRFVLKNPEMQAIIAKIEDSLQCKEIFFNSNMSLSNYASYLGIPEHHLSQVLNQQYRLTFKDFLNKIRIEEAVRIITSEDYNHLSLEGVAKNLGYGSRTTFISAFKKQTGKNPSEFKKGS